MRNVDLSGVTLSPLKQTAIAQLPLGNNVKIQIQVAHNPWVKDGYSGDTLTDAPFDGSWDGSTYQDLTKHANTEILIVVPGGAEGAGPRLQIRIDRCAGTGARVDDHGCACAI